MTRACATQAVSPQQHHAGTGPLIGWESGKVVRSRTPLNRCASTKLKKPWLGAKGQVCVQDVSAWTDPTSTFSPHAVIAGPINALNRITICTSLTRVRHLPVTMTASQLCYASFFSFSCFHSSYRVPECLRPPDPIVPALLVMACLACAYTVHCRVCCDGFTCSLIGQMHPATVF